MADDLGYECLLLEDCCAATEVVNHEAAIAMIKTEGGVFGAVSNSTKLLAALNVTANGRLPARLKTPGTANMPRMAAKLYTLPDTQHLVQDYRFPKISQPIPTSNPLISRATSKTQNPWCSYLCQFWPTLSLKYAKNGRRPLHIAIPTTPSWSPCN
jgi:hypothetical protein